jgi:chloramphenicol-sensitive protein RarD
LAGARFDAGAPAPHRPGLSTSHPSSVRSGNGAPAAAAGFLLWGIVPIYWKQMQGVAATELIAHRIVWSLFFLCGILVWQRNFASLRPAFAGVRAAGLTFASSLLITVNWTVYVWAVNTGHILETSLGYFLVPLMNVALGSLLLHEKLRPLQWGAIGLAALGVVLLLVRVGHFPWIALTIAGSWTAYGLLKKKSAQGPIAGLTAETLILFPAAAGLLVWLAAHDGGVLGHADLRTQAYVLSAGVITAVPLLLFAYGAQRMRLTSLGLLQYLAPSVQFLIGLFLYREPFDTARFQAFALIWAGLIVYSADTFWAQRRMLLRAAGVG